MSYDDEDSLEQTQTLLVVREVSVYKIPPRGTSGGYKCAEWLQSDKIWTGRLRVLSFRDKCEIKLEDSNTGELFAGCNVLPGKRDACVESVTDSSRYFVLRIEDGRGKHAFIGLGFTERNEAFDFNVALSDHEKYVKRELEKEQGGVDDDSSLPQQPSLDLRLKEGQTIRINVKTKPVAGSGMISSATTGGGATGIAATGRMKAPLAPPPGGGRIRAPLPPPPNDTKPTRNSTTAVPALAKSSVSSLKPGASTSVPGSKEPGRLTGDPFADLSQLELALPPAGKQGSSSAGGDSGWAAF